MSEMQATERPRRFLNRRFAFATVGVIGLVAAVIATTANDRLLGKPGDFERLERAPFGEPAYVGNLASKALSETSGLAASRLQDDLLWLINDSGNDPVLHAIGSDGRYRGSLRVEGAKNRDWEDLASFRLPDEASGETRAYILVADIGDNAARRDKLSLYFIEEPALHGERLPEGSTAPVAWRQRFRFEDGPRDAEGIAVDVAERQILIASKRSVPAEVYSLRLPLALPPEPPSREIAEARRIALLDAIPQPAEDDLEESWTFGEYRSQPTAFDISADGRHAVILTYKHAYYYWRAPPESWQTALARQPKGLAVPPMNQTEAGGFARDGKSFFATTEDRPAPLFEIRRE